MSTTNSKSVRDTARRPERSVLLSLLSRYSGWTFHASRFIHAQRTVIYGMVIVSRYLERTNQNNGFNMTALEYGIQNAL